ncbi:hypothetical protein D3C84_1119830 [compost metagenome]
MDFGATQVTRSLPPICLLNVKIAVALAEFPPIRAGKQVLFDVHFTQDVRIRPLVGDPDTRLVNIRTTAHDETWIEHLIGHGHIERLHL